MCFTGGFALAMAVDDDDACAGAEPAIASRSPSATPGSARSACPMPTSRVSRIANELCVLAMRFTNDKAVPAERFEHLREVLGDRLIAIEIENRSGQNPHDIPKMAHSVVTEHLVDEPGHPTQDALHRVLDFFKQRLTG